MTDALIWADTVATNRGYSRTQENSTLLTVGATLELGDAGFVSAEYAELSE